MFIFSDGVLNPSGIRFGPSEIYGVIERFFSATSDGIEDTLCVGQHRPNIDKDERVLLFMKMQDGRRLSGDLVKRIKDAIAKNLSRRHVPAHIFQIDAIPVRVCQSTCASYARTTICIHRSIP